MRTIAILNQKGGTGKTTTAVNLAACIGELGKKVLLIDLDAQANATTHFGVTTAGKGVFDLFLGASTLEALVQRTSVANVDVVPATLWLAQAEKVLAGEVGAEVILRDALATLPAGRWDFVIFDCPPNLGVVSVAALAAVQELLVPLETQPAAMSGLAILVKTLEKVRERLNPHITLSAILACRAKFGTNLTHDVQERLREHFGDLLLKTAVRENTRIAEAYSFGQPVVVYDPRSTGAEDYRAVTKEFLKRQPARS